MIKDRHRHTRAATQTFGTASRALPPAQRGSAVRIKRSVGSPGGVRTITVRRLPGRPLVGDVVAVEVTNCKPLVPRDVPFKVIERKPTVLQAAYTRVTPAAPRQQRRERVRIARGALDVELARVDQCLRSADQHAIVLDVHQELRDVRRRVKKLMGEAKARGGRAAMRR